MKANGWRMDVTNWNDSVYAAQCDPSTWFGYKYGYGIGVISTTLTGSGKALLDFGNCYGHGMVVVRLNNKEIGLAGANTPSKKVSFSYSRNDVLSISEENIAIIKLNFFELSCTG